MLCTSTLWRVYRDHLDYEGNLRASKNQWYTLTRRQDGDVGALLGSWRYTDIMEVTAHIAYCVRWLEWKTMVGA
jgi:hypothetical protein